MWAKDRHHRIVSLLASREQVSLENLAAEFGVSRETLRRDIVKLEAEGRLKRVHGGFMRAEGAEALFQSRVSVNAEAKRRIGAAAARLVEPGMLIVVDAGSTTQAFAEFLTTVPGLKVVTNSLSVAMGLRERGSDAEVTLLGGRLGADTPGTYGEVAVGQLQRLVPQLAFVSPTALSAAKGAMNYDFAEAEVARVMADNAERLVVLADHSKLGHASRVQICGCDRIDTLITDRRAGQAALDELQAAGVAEVIKA